MKSVISAVVFIILMSGCSHKISISPSLDEIREVKIQNNTEVNVGYYISKAAKETEVTTPGGGGDKINYTPYKDTESVLNTMLSKKFVRVYSLKKIDDKKTITNKNIKYIFTSKIHTNSSSTNFLIWPPTNFTMDLTCNAVDTNNNKIWEKTVTAQGYATSNELIKDFSISAKRATKDAFLKMLEELEKTNIFKDD